LHFKPAFTKLEPLITLENEYTKIVIPAKLVPDFDPGAGIQAGTVCRIETGTTELAYLIAGLILTVALLFSH